MVAAVLRRVGPENRAVLLGYLALLAEGPAFDPLLVHCIPGCLVLYVGW